MCESLLTRGGSAIERLRLPIARRMPIYGKPAVKLARQNAKNRVLPTKKADMKRFLIKEHDVEAE